MTKPSPVPQCRYNVVDELLCPRIRRAGDGVYECRCCDLAIVVAETPAELERKRRLYETRPRVL